MSTKKEGRGGVKRLSRSQLMRHLIVFVAGLGLGLLFMGAAVLIGVQAARDAPRVTAVYAPTSPREELWRKVAAADGLIVRRAALPGALEVVGEGPDLARRLREAGAVLVLPALPATLLAMGGCSYLPLAAYERPGLSREESIARKIKAGPL